MTIHAYQEIYLSNIQDALGDAFDYAINMCDIPGNIFIQLFVISSISERIENGDISILNGCSGIDIARKIINETTGKEIDYAQTYSIKRSSEYWIGYVIAYYQWYSSRKFSEIFNVLSYDELLKMYNTLHEADISKFVEVADKRIKEYYPETNLKRIRNIYGISQSELSRLSGVSLRSIQMYEQRNKDINKASVTTLYHISRVLGCSIEDLIEK